MTAVIRAFLFDLDGTLIDHEAAAALALTQALRVIPGLDHRDHARARARWKELEEQAMARYLSGHLTFTEQRRLRVISLAAELGLGAWDDTRADAWFTGYLRHYEAAWRTYRDVRPALDALTEQHPDLRLGVLTNGDADQQRTKLRSVGLADELTPVIASSEAGAAKPSGRIFQHACTRLELEPAHVAYVGDRLHTDAIAATHAGLCGIWLNRGDDPAPEGVLTIQTLQALPGLLTALGR
jgi:putative hydrolase of the HAD superfamily